VTLPYALVDADNHYYEPRDAFTRHMPSKDAHLAVHVDDNDDIFIGAEPYVFLRNNYDRVVKPGALKDMLRTLKSGHVDESGASSEEPVQPAYVDRAARLATMDDQGVEACMVFPTLAVCVTHQMRRNTPQLEANVTAFNRWLADDWGYGGADGRIFGAPLLSLHDVDFAVRELDDALANGAKVVSLMPGPAGTAEHPRSPADPHFDPFWSRVNEAHTVVAFHIGESGYNELFSTAWGERPNPPSHEQSAFQWASFYGDRPIMDTVSALVLHNLFGRFPNVRIASIENGSLWVPYLLAQLDKMKGMGRNGPWPGGYVDGRPSDILKRHLFVSPFHEENIPALVELLGASQVLFGSDYPHPEGLAEPASYVDGLKGLTDEETRLIMRDNTAQLLRLAS
jgi:predicted TIM-barrel fold metal-dependent hydrolase